MEKFSEKIMEDEIAKNPEKYLQERDLKLLARQYSIGKYRFDLLFEDRHKGKLIVELQKGSLDRNHTYKILDYYHEYKDQNPKEFVDVMIVANEISVERKKRLNDLSISYREIPENMFADAFSDGMELIPSHQILDHNKMETNSKKEKAKGKGEKRPSAFLHRVHKRLKNHIDSNVWDKRGEKSLEVKHKRINEIIANKTGVSFKAQIWMARPENGKATCKFEIAEQKEEKEIREEIAKFIRTDLENKLLKQKLNKIKPSTGSTIINTSIQLTKIQSDKDDVMGNFDMKTIERVINFYDFLEKSFDEKFIQIFENKLTEIINKEKFK